MYFFNNSRRFVLPASFLFTFFVIPVRSQEVMEGRAFAEKHCARCHSIGLTGNSPHISAPPFRNIAAKGRVDDLQEALAEGITVGHPDMPQFKLTPKQIASVIAYLKQLAPGAHR
jgi:cytochrome c